MVASVFTLLVIASIAVGAGMMITLPILFIKKKYYILTLIFGLLALIAAFPVGFWLTIGVGNTGWVIGIILGIAGAILLIKGYSLRNAQPRK